CHSLLIPYILVCLTSCVCEIVVSCRLPCLFGFSVVCVGCSCFPGTSSTLRTSTQPQILTFGSIPRSSCEQMTWKQAQVYCTANHIDLATVQSDEDWANLRDVVQKMTKTAWIGLYNDINSWQWSYQNKEIAFRSWSSGEPNNYGGYEACGLTYGSSWNDYDCNSLLPFFCFNGKK
uniref:C-type lectin domain-containing protein n=1 Tax=Cyprinus carpio TaxID=7962 RepID=A0A8C1R9D5_CYPCA